jgi:hypothetical protein
MRKQRVLLIAFLAASVSAMAQYRGGGGGGGLGTIGRPGSGPVMGWGNSVFPGGSPGHPTITGNITNPGFAGALGATVRGVPPRGPVGGGRPGMPPGNFRGNYGRGGGRTIVVPYPVVAYPYGYGFGYGNAGYVEDPNYVQQQALPQQQQQQAPLVIINQGYKPEVISPQLRDYSDLPAPAGADSTLKVYENKPKAFEEEKPTIYLIAMKEGTIMPALAFWVEGDTLNYITRESSHNRISLDRVDRDFSKKLNQERGLEFRIP